MKNSIIKITLSWLLFSFAVITVNAQDNAAKSATYIKFGFKGGVNFSNMYTENVDDSNVLTGLNAGIFVKLPISTNIAIQPELYYTTKGSEVIYNNAFVSGTAKFRVNYVEMPVLLVVNISEVFNFQIGPYVGYLLDGKVTNESTSPVFNFEDNIDPDEFNKIDAGVAAGVGVDFGNIGIGARYNYGLTKVGKERTYAGTSYTFPDGKNSVLSFYATYTIPIL